MKFFFDNNLGENLSKGLRAFGENVMHLKERFSEDAPDQEWLRYLGENGIFLVTRDDRVRHRPNELQALKQNTVGAFFLGGKNRSKCELIQQVVRNWPRMKQLAGSTDRPFAFRVPPSGTKLTAIPLT
jgi:predicted nuclease of predicted toxin-antitoxin system